MDSATWAVADHSVHPAPEDDFQQFLDMNSMGALTDGINYNFHHDFQPSPGSQLLQPHAREAIDIPMSGTDAPILLSPAVAPMQHQMTPITTATAYQPMPATMMPPPSPSGAIVDSIDAQIQFLQQQKLRHQQRQMEEQQVVFFTRQQSRMVPPTPQSLEIRPTNNQYYGQPTAPEQQQQQQAIEYRYQRIKDQTDMSFTPLVSPAVTPLDTHFSVDQFAVSGAYFSPLTSPALHAQTDPLAMFDQLHRVVTTSSPVDMDLDASNAPPMQTTTPGDLAKKVRKNAAKARAKSGIKQSPISKPLRRRTATTPSMNAQVLSELTETTEQNHDPQLLPTPMMQTQTSSSSTTGITDSEDSVSPEALNDMAPVEMPPPPIPKPRSARPSPYIAPQASAVPVALQPPRPGLSSPATPASLMKLNSPSARSVGAMSGTQEAVVDTDHIETFELPESANFLHNTATPSVAPTPKPHSHDSGASKTPSLGPLPSPALVKPAAPGSATQSPQLLAGAGFGTRKTPQLLPRGSKKRGSVSSIPVSPALRPKISPSIKPLLPGGPDVEEAASQLLATKSNYQRILEGNTLPGVSYPSELSTNLTSKRTSHKIAEQGRRNRINSALQEIATLLPLPPKDSEGEGSDSKKDKNGGGAGGANNAPNSKASTVEMAIEYIKQLQQEVAAANRRADEAEKKLGAAGKAAEGA
ncbi:helix-loop-helix DNA-binding domain-containing protein [Staphylotrichum tortipilum]|uniref:Helix-loop-helix DNA-binding domain-containing protein n=1 Tax=Staphylotrichum tortipilum TaxID=2831512 RepID=A0AAN6MTI3_9PEZI|nr:helix-loop-helix DNA-binding domain-containing protein [Staphylotrichum longicolle]